MHNPMTTITQVLLKIPRRRRLRARRQAQPLFDVRGRADGSRKLFCYAKLFNDAIKILECAILLAGWKYHLQALSTDMLTVTQSRMLYCIINVQNLAKKWFLWRHMSQLAHLFLLPLSGIFLSFWQCGTVFIAGAASSAPSGWLGIKREMAFWVYGPHFQFDRCPSLPLISSFFLPHQSLLSLFS